MLSIPQAASGAPLFGHVSHVVFVLTQEQVIRMDAATVANISRRPLDIALVKDLVSIGDSPVMNEPRDAVRADGGLVLAAARSGAGPRR